ncbi:MAG: nitrogen regulation protein NR(I) [Proteobacteria bacterium]|nr:nitrogen regulation protein NR(I) [Pseudomonadota bacterium]
MTPRTILIADDDRSVRTVLSRALSRSGHDVRSTDNATTLWDWVSGGAGDLVITDVVMPDGNGLDLVPRMKAHRPDLPVIVVSAHSTLMTAVKAARSGAYEYLAKPFDLDSLLGTVERALADPAGKPCAEAVEDDDMPLIVGRSPAMQDIFRTIGRLALTDLTVLIEGESGSGKELVARALHEFGERRDRPFVAVNVAAIPRELVESELFGHERGAFTGAHQRRSGRFSQAEGGTLFLDEIGDMPGEAQTRLLRVLQEGRFTPVGGRESVASDVRIVTATHRDLVGLIDEGRFREDLYYRLNVVPIRVPPLRERREDVPLLVRHFLKQAVREGLPDKRFDAAAMAAMQEHRWSGNVRELENLVRRLVVLVAEDTIDDEAVHRELQRARSGDSRPSPQGLAESVESHLRQYFDAHDDGLPPAGLYDRILREIERPLLALTLQATQGNQLRAADVLGINRNTLRKKLRDLDLAAPRGQALRR